MSDSLDMPFHVLNSYMSPKDLNYVKTFILVILLFVHPVLFYFLIILFAFFTLKKKNHCMYFIINFW